MDCSLPGSSVHGILQARILEWIFFSRGSSQPRDWTHVSQIAGGFFTVWATREDLVPWPGIKPVSPAVEVWKVLTTGPPGKFLFTFLRNHHTVFQSGCTNSLFHQQCVRVLFSPHPHQHLLSVPFFFITTILTLYFIVVLLCISLMVRNIEQTCSQILSLSSPFGTPILWTLLHLPWSQRSLNLPSFFTNSIFPFSVHDFQCSVFQFTDSFLYII